MIDTHTGSREPLAVIGIGCRFPGNANDPTSFRKLLADGVDAITELPAERWNTKSFYDADAGKPGRTQARWGGFLSHLDQFDPHFFGISPREAARMDPQQRLLLEVAYEALEDGGQVLERLSGSRTAVFVGISSWDYSLRQMSFHDRGVIDTYTNTGGSLSIAANRVSYCFDFRGPSVSVDTACSSALVAVHLACRSIWEEGCPLALAAGVNVLLMPDWYIGFSRLGMLSPDGRCKAFDAGANGFVRSEGAGVIVLKPLSRALADGERIYAVIRGTAVNQDGRTPGMTVPSQQAQEELLRAACQNAGVPPVRIQYVEAHGTGTLVGDPIEARALGNVLSAERLADRPCLVGSVKTNIGHLEAGAGIAGVIKTALALHHRFVPANLHFHQPNPQIDFRQLRLRIPVRGEPWPEGEGPALAGVNSFGYGGTNAHVIMQEAPQVRAASVSEREHDRSLTLAALIPLSARSPEALRATVGDLHSFLLASSEDISLDAFAANAALRRSHHEHRLALVAHTKQELAEQLAAYAAGQPVPGASMGRAANGNRPRIAFVCSGQGPQWWAMGRQLLEQEPIFRDVIQHCDAIVRQLGPWSLWEELTADEGRSRMEVTAISQPAIFALQVALAAVWRSWEVSPEAVIGHSVGEVAAAHLAGVFSLEEAMRVIFQRGRCMELAPLRGRMLAAALPPEEARRLIAAYGEGVSLAAINGPASVTLSGELEPLEAIARELEKRQIFSRFLRVHYAFHSGQMDPVREELLTSLRGLQPQRATLPLISTVTGRRIEGPEMGPDYWWQNVRQTVLFAEGVDRLMDGECDTVVELSPHPVLTAAVAECYRRRGRPVNALASLRRREDERAAMLRSVGQLHVHGHAVDWSGVFPESHCFLRLPLYPWQKQRCWFESDESRWTRLRGPLHPLLGRPLLAPMPSWENRFDLRLQTFLVDHCVQGAAIVPATAYIETALAAAREIHAGEDCQLEDIKLSNPCFLTVDRPLWFNTVFDREDAVVRIHSRAIGDDASAENEREWTVHFSAVPRKPQSRERKRAEIDAIRKRCPKELSHEECYAVCRKLGLDYGSLFQGIEGCWQGEGEALGIVRLSEELTAEQSDWLFHPALLDSCFQVVVLADRTSVDDGLYLPAEIERFQLFHRPSGRLWSHARMREKTARWATADLDIYDEAGELIAEIRGLQSRRVAGGSADSELESLTYAYEWQKSSERGCVSAPCSCERDWLLFADRGGIGENLAHRLRADGADCLLVFSGTQFARLATDRFIIDPRSREDMDRLFREVDFARSRPGGFIHLWNLDAPPADGLSSEALETAQDAGLLSALHLVQAWEKISDAQVSPLILATRGVQTVDENEEPAGLVQSPALGLGRVIVSECPQLRCKIVDLPANGSCDEDAGALFAELHAADEEDEVAWRGSARYVHRFVPTPVNRDPKGSACRALPFGSRLNEGFRLASLQPGSLDSLTPRALCRQPPGPGQVEIEVAAAGLNFSDVMKALGIYPGLADGPVPLGAECAGRITAVGEGVGQAFQPGDEVLAVAPFSFASHVTTRAELVVAKPKRIGFEEAATIPIAFLTAFYALDYLARLSAGERVLVHSASGGVGLAAVQLARQSGAEIFATAGTPEKRKYLQELGIAHVMDSRSLAFADEILEQTAGRGVDVILNSLAGEAIARGLKVLADHGRFLEIGKRDIYQNSRLGLRPFHKNLSFFAIDLDRMMRERPALLGSLLRRLIEDVNAGRLNPLPHRVFPIAEATAAFRIMQQGKHIGKLVLSMRERPAAIAPNEDPLTFRADASYLIAGGLGGFGLAVARWMVERGARHLVLVGRRGIHSDEARQAVAELERLGARIVVRNADIAKEDDVALVLSDMKEYLPPLRGVIHAAMVLEDCLLANLDRERMRRVLAPKVNGAWNLHRHTLDHPLDFFVLFSSLASVFGNPGQGNYAAANAFLDALAHYRRARGLPGLAINWGFLGDVGYLSQRPQLGERLEREGVLSFPARQALTLLERAMKRQAIQVGVMRVDWSRWRGGVTDRVSSRFAHLLSASKSEVDGDGRGVLPTRETVRAAAAEERRGLLEALLRDKVARVLGSTPVKIDSDKPLLNLGLDSLMAVELRNWMESELGVNLPIVELMRCPGLSHLSETLSSSLSDGKSSFSREPEASENGRAPLPVSGHRFIVPLSYGQRGLWFLYEMDRSSSAYNLYLPCRILSPMDVDAFCRAWTALVGRHDSLRTTFAERDGQLMQQVHPDASGFFEVIDASTWTEEKLRARLEEEVNRPFDLERGSLVRIQLFSRAPSEYVFLAVAHHLVGDLRSLVILVEELRSLYPSECGAASAALRPLTSRYGDFVRWQADLLAGPEGERLACYWEEQLAGVPTALDLPTDRPRPARFNHRGATVPCRISAELTRRLKALAGKEQVTLYTVLLAAFQTLLCRYTGQQDFVIGSPFAGRGRPEFDWVVGYFINMLPLRANLSGDPTFRALLGRVGPTVLEALQHQDYPFSLIVERLNLKRDPSRTPLVQASFALEKSNRPSEPGNWRFYLPGAEVHTDLGGLRMDSLAIERRTCQTDLELVLDEDGTAEGLLCYNTDLFDRSTIERMVGHYQTLLEGIADNPERRLSELPWLSEAESRQVVDEWNATQADFPRDLCLHQLFEQQARRTPDAPAVRLDNRTLSYAELDARANRLAYRLHWLDAGPNALVALFLERSPEMVTAILGTLKAGAAYVPLDPDSPTDRMRTVLEATRAPIVLTQRHLKDRLPALGRKVICVDADEEWLDDGAENVPQGPENVVGPGDLAYVIYTSGSTGRPKGVMIEHRAICNTLAWRQRDLPVHPGDRVLLMVPYFFDPSICIMFSALAGGAELILAEPGEERDPMQLLERVAESAATILPVPPRLLRLMLDGPFAEKCRTVRSVYCGGEAMPPDLPDRLFAQLDVELHNLYGPTEAAVEATWWTCRRGDERPVIPIGRPIANVQTYVLDSARRPLPVGVPGELYIGGAGLARGYLNDDEQTVERFPSINGERLYRTGDRCRWLADGSLDFLGRIDQQVKVRGYRIEIGEVEAALADHPSVREAAVCVKTDGAGDQRLIAYVVAAENGEEPSVERLRGRLREKLPEYMVPAMFVPLPALPRTSTGKVDRRALPAPPNGRPQLSHPYVPPRTPLEEFLAKLWRDVLHVEQIGVEDNFFELGGNSIQAAMLIHRLQEDLGEHVSTVALFDSPTLCGLAHHLIDAHHETTGRRFGLLAAPHGNGSNVQNNGHALTDRDRGTLVPLQRNGSLPPCFMVHPPGGIVMCYQALAQRMGDDRPIYGIRARGLHDGQELPARLEDMAAEYVAALRERQPEGPYHLGGWSLGGVVALEMAQQLLAQGQAIGLLAFLDTTIPFGHTNRAYAEEADLSGREYGLDISFEDLAKLGPDEQLPYLWDHVRKLGLVEEGTPLSVVRQLLDDLKRMFHAHVQLSSEYEIRPYPGRITLFRPSESPVATPTSADRGWGRLAASVEVHFVPGHHHTMVKEPHVQVLAQKLRECLLRTESIESAVSDASQKREKNASAKRR